MQRPAVPGPLGAGDRSRLDAVLARSRELGMLGPGPVGPHLERSLALLPLLLDELAVDDRAGGHDLPADEARALDLGSGGGVPGLPLALATPGWRWTLLDGSVTRTAWLTEAVADLGLGDRVEVLTARAEDAGRGPLRGALDVVVARGFAGPAPTAECAAPLLRHGGAAVVTEPPGGAPDRWSAEGLAALGLSLAGRRTEPVALQALRKTGPTPDRYPRRTGVPVKRPLW